MFEIKNVMTTDVITVNKNAPLYDVIRLLIEHNITGMPVVDDNMHLVGIISEKNILRLLYEVEYFTSATVEDFMTTDVVSFDVEDSLVNVCDCLIQNQFRRVPVLSKGKLVGIISRKNIINNIFEYQDFFRDVPNRIGVHT
jgi:CBS domain-containing protein